MNWNSLFITVGTGSILWFLKLIFAAVMYLVNTLPPMRADVNQLKTDVKLLQTGQQEAKQAIQVAAEKSQKELNDAEQRVKNEFTKLLNEQIKKKRVMSGPTIGDGKQ